MSSVNPEWDWRRFKTVHNTLLERYCSRILVEVAALSRAAEGTAHDRCVKAYRLIRERDKQMANAFDDFRRSTAVMQLLIEIVFCLGGESCRAPRLRIGRLETAGWCWRGRQANYVAYFVVDYQPVCG